MRFLASAIGLLTLVLCGCGGAQGMAAQGRGEPGWAARLVLASVTADGQRAQIRALDADSLEDDASLEPLEMPACAGGLSVAPNGVLAVVVGGASPRCHDAPSATFELLDLQRWTWRQPIALPVTADERQGGERLRLDVSDRWPIAWSADSAAIFALTTTDSEQRRLWRIDASGSSAPLSAAIDFVPQRIDVAPNGSAIFVLGGQSRGNSRRGAAVPGSAFVAIYDPQTLAERVRVPLSGLSLGTADGRPGTLQPGVAVAPDGSRYFVAHADRPLLDVVDTRAPKLERLERSVSLRDAPSQFGTRQAWLGVSPDGGRLFTWRRAAAPGDDLGLQMVDLKTWKVTTVDAVAQRIGWSLDGRWAFALDPAGWARPGATRGDWRGPRAAAGTAVAAAGTAAGAAGTAAGAGAAGARLSVLDATGRTEVAVLARDDAAFGVAQYAPERVIVSFGGRGNWRLEAFDTTTWAKVAERRFDGPASLVGARAVW